ncbi:MAG: baseplate J/gp47 family protein [Solibacillus sp.]|uniref:baseplate assembly protein n=1 Tax=Solibacillus sp. TaxID=1909654 RepID=UPI0033156804
MANRFNLPDIDFLEKEPEQIEAEMLQHVSDKTGFTLMRADPRRKFLQSLATFVSIERNRMEHALRQNRLAYAEDNSLDHMGLEMSTERIEAKAAKTIMAFVLEAERPHEAYVIDAGELVSVGEVYFAIDEVLIIPAGQSIGSVGATCTELGEIGNNYLVGEISTLVRPKAYVNSVQNTTVSSGGAELESDDAYAERIRLAPESFSTAGPELAYVYWVKTASTEIADVKAESPKEGHVDVYILMQNGRLPTSAEIQEVDGIINDSQVRPLTDLVSVNGPEQVSYEALATYWISKSNETVASIIQKQVENEYQEYIKWQRSKMGRDVDMSELIARLKSKGASRVAVNSEMFIEVAKNQVAIELPTSELSFGGIADE